MSDSEVMYQPTMEEMMASFAEVKKQQRIDRLVTLAAGFASNPNLIDRPFTEIAGNAITLLHAIESSEACCG